MDNDLAAAIRASAQRIGADPVDLATVISYETAGTFDPWKAGPTTQWGQHRGLIQWGEPQRQQYGVTQGMPVPAQMQAVEKYLVNAGYKPGMGLMDMYSAVNAGKVGRYGASDANNGGAPGTVADKVNNQMGDHRAKAAALLGGTLSPGGAQLGFGGGLPAAPATPEGIAGMFTGGPAGLAMGVPADPVNGALAQREKTKARQALEAEADQTRRAALLSGVGSMFG